MSCFEWGQATELLSSFGGEPTVLYVPKTGLPFFDTLRLYGAIDLYIGLREDISVSDQGNYWEILGNARKHFLKKRVDSAAQILKEKPLTKKDEQWIAPLENAVKNKKVWPMTPTRNLKTPLDAPDSALKDGIRDQAAMEYSNFASGGSNELKIPWADAVLAFAGKKRTEKFADILFLPVFHGKVDFSKVVNPLRLRLRFPNVACAQALMLLALKISLFSEGYQERLSAVVYNTNLDARENYNYSGMIQISSTAVGMMKSPELVSQVYKILQILVRKAWIKSKKSKKSTEYTPDALAMASWIMQPKPKNLASMITSQERLKKINNPVLFGQEDYVKEIFKMSYGKWQGDFETVKKFAKAVASSIYFVHQKDAKDTGKAWYDQITMLRSASSAKAFINRAMIMIEQGHRRNTQIATVHRQEDFDPQSLLASLGENQGTFETFRDLFRMYLVQENVYKPKDENAAEGMAVQDELENQENKDISEDAEDDAREGDQE